MRIPHEYYDTPVHIPHESHSEINYSIDARIDYVCVLIWHECRIEVSYSTAALVHYVCMLTFKLTMYACTFDMSAYAFVPSLHELRSPNN